jgi:DNA helicase-2/ATP-dependent DNA helicase PcrA
MQAESFEQHLEHLNTEQRRAVDQIYGPVMVIAGPGTGKTQILAMRIGNILTQTDTSPRNILCLTYTEAGTVAMRQRLTELIGPEAYNVNIYTFHGFCNQIILDYPDLFSEHDDLRPIDDLERLDLYIKLIDHWPVDHPLKRLKGDLYAAKKGLHQLFNLMKSEGWTSDFVINRIDQAIADLPTTEGFYYKRANKTRGIAANDPNQSKIDDQIKKYDRLKAGALAFDEFQALMKEAGRYDYADMILWVLDAIQTNEDLLADLQEQFQFFLVDEYQDTNGAQNDILFTLCGNLHDKPNVFIVGDDDQAIYRFQGANLSNILDFMDLLKADLFPVVLKDNYRSSNTILQAADDLVDHNEERLTKWNTNFTKKLVAAGNNLTYTSGPLVGDFESETEELLAVQYYVEQLMQSGVEPNQIAILFRKRAHVEPLIKYFVNERIPHTVKKIDNILTDPFIVKLLTILRYIQSEIDHPLEGDFSLFEILHYDWFDIPSIDIAHLAVALQTHEIKNWRHFITHTEGWENLPLTAKDNLHAFVALMEGLIKTGINGTIQELFETLIYSKPIFNFITSSGESFHYLKMSNTLFNFIKDQMDKHHNFKLSEFLVILDKMVEYEIALPETKIDKTGDGIQLMTAHGSKGLEFEYVIVIGCNSTKWEAAKPPPPPFTYPPTLIQTNTENKIEDERRLFYVCMTRAKKEVLLTYSKVLLNGKAAAPSRFIIEIEKSGFSKPWQHSSSDEERDQFLLSQYAPRPHPLSQYPAQIDDILQNMTLNISGVNKYLTCPLNFYYENILRAPMARTAPMGYGNAIHEALDRIFKREENVDGGFPSLENLLFYFKKGMERFHSHFSPKQFESYLANGEIKLRAYYEYHIESWKKLTHSKTEMHIKNVHIEGIPVSGIFDRIDIDDNELDVIDYKTGGAYPYGVQKMKGPAEDNSELTQQLEQEQDADKRHLLRLKIEGGDYWRQLVFYKLLYDADASMTQRFRSTYISFIESDDAQKYYRQDLTISKRDEDFVRNQLKTTYEYIQNKVFGPGCGRTSCRWCNLLGVDK